MEDSVAQKRTDDVNLDSLQSKLLFYKQKAAYRIACGYAKGTTVLDVGCGAGYGAALMASWADAVVGVDQDEGAIKYCSDRYGKIPNLSFKENSKGAFGLVTCFQVVEHVPETEEFLENIYRRARGTLIITTPNAERRWLRRGQKPWNDEHVREYREDEVRTLLKKVCAEVKVAGIHGSPDADLCERVRVSGDDMDIALRRPHKGDPQFSDDDFAMGPAEGSLDLIAVCR